MSSEGRGTFRVPFGVVAWLCVASGALGVADIPGEYGGSMCGVWGCYPPLQALIAMHLFWFVAMVPVVLALAWYSPRHLRRIGVVMAAGAGLTAVGVVGWDVVSWVRWSDELRPHWPKRALYTLLTTSDVPLIQTFLAGIASIALGRNARLPVDENVAGHSHSPAEGTGHS